MKPKVTVVKVNYDFYRVRLTIGVQSFDLKYIGTRKDCQWYAKMVRIALDKICVHKEKP